MHPAREEQEYTAALVFAITTSLSWWAFRLGKARLQVPIQAVGRREHWLQLRPESLREWLMAPMAIICSISARICANCKVVWYSRKTDQRRKAMSGSQAEGDVVRLV